MVSSCLVLSALPERTVSKVPHVFRNFKSPALFSASYDDSSGLYETYGRPPPSLVPRGGPYGQPPQADRGGTLENSKNAADFARFESAVQQAAEYRPFERESFIQPLLEGSASGAGGRFTKEAAQHFFGSEMPANLGEIGGAFRRTMVVGLLDY